MTAARSMNEAWAGLVVEELVRNGVNTFCYASGSRSTPLVAAVAGHPLTNAVIHVDERGVGFYAVGYARATGRPAAVVTTSGTAAANLLPAVIESAQSAIPMLVLTADRPPELRDTGANQTMRQAGLYGGYTRWAVDMPCPDRRIPPAYVLTTIDQACHAARHPVGGPVHLNCMFREPLAPVLDGENPSAWLKGVSGWADRDQPYTRCEATGPPVPVETLRMLRQLLSQSRRGIVAVGELQDDVTRDACLALIDSLGWPAFADIASGLRLDNRSTALIPHYDVLLGDPGRIKDVDMLLHIGGRLVSSRWLEALASQTGAALIHLTDRSERLDPTHQVQHRVEVAIAEACLQLCAETEAQTDPQWVAGWKDEGRRIAAGLSRWDDEEEAICEPWVARRLAADLPAGWGWAIASSMPVRDVNRFGGCRAAPPAIACNRGVSGIDGTLSTAVGFGDGLQRPVALLIGDLALLHDLNSLQLVRRSRRQVVIVVINNNGGGIFHFLPIERHPEVFETHFGTPHGLRFRGAAQMYGLWYAAPETRSQFAEALQSALAGEVPALIEVRTDRVENRALHDALEARLLRDVRGT